MRTLALLLAGLLVIIAVPSVPAVPGSVEYQLILDCPQLDDLGAAYTTPCPIQAIDAQDIMGSPSIAVDPNDENVLILASLHGFAGDGPTDRSRTNQVFTTFISTDHGVNWQDNPYFPRVANIFGEHPQAMVDSYGHVNIGSLYSTRSGGGYTYKITAQKFADILDVNENQLLGDGSYKAEVLDPIHRRNVIDQFWFVYDYATDITTLVWNEHPPKRAPTSNVTDVDLAPELPVAGLAQHPAGELPTSLIGVAWTTVAETDNYRYAPDANLIGPCASSTNPVLADGQIYIGCIVDPAAGPYPWRSNIKEGQIDIFRFDLQGGEPEYLGKTPIRGGTPKLGVRSDGRLAIFSTSIKENAVQLAGAYGTVKASSKGIDWGRIHDYSSDIQTPRPGYKLLEANIQDLLYREQSGVVHIILKERFLPTPIPGLPDNLDKRSHYAKSILAIDEGVGYLKRFNLDIGNILNQTRNNLDGQNDPNDPHRVFNDLTDDLMQLPPKNFSYEGKELGDLYQREFFVIADYGVVNFAELVEITNLRAPGAPAVPGPVPIPTPALDIGLVLTGTAGTALAGLLALSFALNRHRSTTTAVTKQK